MDINVELLEKEINIDDENDENDENDELIKKIETIYAYTIFIV